MCRAPCEVGRIQSKSRIQSGLEGIGTIEPIGIRSALEHKLQEHISVSVLLIAVTQCEVTVPGTQ